MRALRPKLNVTTSGYRRVEGICDLRADRVVAATIGEVGGESVLRRLVLFAGAPDFGGGGNVTTGAPSVALTSLATLCDFECPRRAILGDGKGLSVSGLSCTRGFSSERGLLKSLGKLLMVRADRKSVV